MPFAALWLVGVLFVVWWNAYLDRNILTLLVPSLKQTMGVSDVQISLLQGLAFSFFFIVAGYPIGRLADQYSRRMILFVGMIGWSLVTTATGFVDSFEGIFVMRMLSGIGEACLMPASVSLVADYFAPERRGRVMGLLLGGASLGIAGSTLAGGVLLDLFAQRVPSGVTGFVPWQLTFIAVGIPGFFAALLLLRISEPERQMRGPMSEAVMGMRQLLTGRWLTLIFLLAAFGMNLLAAYGSGAWLATLLMREYGIRPGNVGIVLGIMHLVIGGCGPFLGGWISDTASRRFLRTGRLHFVAVVFAAQMVAGLLFLVFRSYAATMIINSISVLFTTFLAASALAVVPEAAPDRARARVMSIYQLVSAIIGMGLGPLCVAMATDYLFKDEAMVRESIGMVFFCTSVIGFICALMAVRHRRREMQTLN